MNQGEVEDLVFGRAAAAGLDLPETLVRRLATYYRLLSHWNRTINLTSLSDPAEAIDRLLLEPVAAAAYLPRRTDLIDLGSGGGSPAVPLALSLDSSRFVMVESRARKSAFLREVLRELQLPGSVETARFEQVVTKPLFVGAFDLVSVRAVKLDRPLLEAARALLRPHGHVALFRTATPEDPLTGLPSGLSWLSSYRLLPSSGRTLTLIQRA